MSVYFFSVELEPATPLCGVTLTTIDGYLEGIRCIVKRSEIPSIPGLANALQKETERQLKAYFNKELQKFDLPIRPAGTSFQNEVWRLLREIPYGQTRSYGEVAAALGDSKKSRAVGQAANRNPLPVIIPCHRVIGANGRLTGYAYGLSLKEYLLWHEHGGVV